MRLSLSLSLSLSNVQSFSGKALKISAQKPLMLVDLGGVGGIEGNPQEDETSVEVIDLFGLIEPAQRADGCASAGWVLGFALATMALLQSLHLQRRRRG